MEEGGYSDSTGARPRYSDSKQGSEDLPRPIGLIWGGTSKKWKLKLQGWKAARDLDQWG